MKKIFLLTIISTLFSCSSDKQPDLVTKDTATTTLVKPINQADTDKKRIPDNSRWTATADTSNYIVDITFHDEYLLYWFHGQCIYYYFTYNIGDSVELQWSYKTDCLLNMDMLEKSYGLKNYPKKGDAFSSYKLINDSTLKVTYYFPDWTRKVNQVAKDTIFPNYFKKYK